MVKKLKIKENIFDTSDSLQYLTYDITGSGVTITKCDESASNIVIPSKIEGYPVTEIGDYAFEGCTGLTSITIPNTVTTIGSSAFEGCSGLTSVRIPNSVTTIGDYAFRYCDSLTSITIPNSVTEIGYSAFYGCDNLQEMTISEKLFKKYSRVFNTSALSNCEFILI